MHYLGGKLGEMHLDTDDDFNINGSYSGKYGQILSLLEKLSLDILKMQLNQIANGKTTRKTRLKINGINNSNNMLI